MRFDSTPFFLFLDVWREAGRHPINGKKEGCIKKHIAFSV
jgi:hypothetical protein